MRIGAFLIACAMLFAALRIHKAQGKSTKVTKQIGVGLAFVSGCCFLMTFVGNWMGTVSSLFSVIGVVGLIISAVIVAVDWLVDKRPDSPAFWAAVVLPFFIVFGWSQIPRALGQMGAGWDRVLAQLSQLG
jgi:hypothetical protein